MSSLLLVVLQIVAASGILYGYYHFFLRNKRFHQYNRFYLLGAAAICLLIPFLQIPIYFTSHDSTPAMMLKTLDTIYDGGEGEAVVYATGGIRQSRHIDWSSILFTVYCLVGLVFLLRVAVSIVKVRAIAARYRVERLEGINFVNTGEPGTPFSFFRWLFWDRTIELRSEKGQQIFRHEVFHIQQKHSWDLVFMELLTTVLWINPFFHLIKKELKAIHEFLADGFAVKDNQHLDYAELLLMQALQTRHSLVNPFFHNQIKRRIAMITNPQKTSHRYLRKLLVLPLTAAVVSLFAFKFQERKPIQLSNLSTGASMHNATVDPDRGAIDKEVVNNDRIGITNGTSRADTVPLKLAEVTIEDRPTIIKLDSPGKTLTGAAPMYVLDGKRITDMNVIAPDQIQTVNVLKGVDATSKYGKDAANGVVEIVSKPTLQSLTIVKGEPVYLSKLTGVKVEGSMIKEVRPTLQLDKRDRADLDEVVVVGYSKTAKRGSVVESIDKEPSFPGGSNEWRKYLERNLDLTEIMKKGAPTGNFAVTVQFVVDKDGSLSNVKALSNFGYGIEEEAVRVIVNGPKWVPGENKGVAVSAARRQPIVFVIIPENEDGVKSVTSKEVVVTGYPTKTLSGIFTTKADEVTVQGYSNKMKSAGKVEEVVVNGYSSKPTSATNVTLTEIGSDRKIDPGILNDTKLTRVYPNPTSQDANLEFDAPQAGDASIQVFDIKGQLKMSKKVELQKGKNTVSLNTGGLLTGNYIIAVYDSGKHAFQSFNLIKE